MSDIGKGLVINFMKMRYRHKSGKKLRLLLLLIASVFATSFLAIFAMIYNYISKINFVDDKGHWPKVNMAEDNFESNTNAVNDDISLSSAVSDKKAGFDDNMEQEQANIIYETSRFFDDPLNIKKLEDESKSGQDENDLPVLKQDRIQIQDMQRLQDTPGPDNKETNTDGGSNIAGKLYDGQDKADGISTEFIESSPDEEEADIEPIKDDKVTNILLIGHDLACKNSSSTESFALFTINKRSKKLITTSFYNNIYLYIPGVGKERLVTAYKLGGTRLLQETLEKNFGIVIDGFIMADYSAYIDIVDLIGGVELDIADQELDPLNRNIREINTQLGYSEDADLINKEGKTVLNGKQALGYSRNWYDDYGKLISHGNQKAVVLSILNKVKDFNIIQMNGFLNEVLPKITTNLSEGKIIEFIIMLPFYFNYKIDYLTLPLNGTEKKLRLNGITVLDFHRKQNISQLRSRLYALQ